MNLLYNSNTSEYARVFKILVFGFIPISITYVFGTLLTANGNLKELNTLSLITLGLNIGINILLIPRIQECGSAIASLSAQSFVAIAQIVVAFKIFKFKPPYRTIIQLAAYTAIVIAGNKVFGLLNMHWIAHIACMAVTMGLSLIALRLIKIKELIAMLKEKTLTPITPSTANNSAYYTTTFIIADWCYFTSGM
jgi:O-antigen/teichoic acid export membrane protein